MIGLTKPWGRKPAPPAPRKDLSASLIAVIDTASIHIRPSGDDDLRVVVMFDGGRMWNYSDEAAAAAIGCVAPELTDQQMGMAVQRLRARIKAHVRATAENDPDPARRPYMQRY